MDNLERISRILTEGVPCPSCGEDNPQSAISCESCGAPLRTDEPSMSVTSSSGLESQPQRAPDGVPLESSPNFVLLQKAANGIRDGSLPPEEYKSIVKRLRTLAEIGQKILESPVVDNHFQKLPPEQQAARENLRMGFVEIDQGTQKMLDYLSNGNLGDVTEGAAITERGFRMVERARNEASDLRSTEKP